MKSDNFEIDEDFITKHIKNDRDKDLLVYKEDSDFLICCKYRPLKKIGFNDIERIESVARSYNSQPVIVTTTDYSYNAKDLAHNSNIILTYEKNIVKKLNLHIERELNEKELDILSKILPDEI